MEKSDKYDLFIVQYSSYVYSKLSKISSQRKCCQSLYKQTVKRKFCENQGNFNKFIFFNTVLVNRTQYNPTHEYVILFTIGPLGRTESPGIQRLGLLLFIL